jgi:hypothetical protein
VNVISFFVEPFFKNQTVYPRVFVCEHKQVHPGRGLAIDDMEQFGDDRKEYAAWQRADVYDHIGNARELVGGLELSFRRSRRHASTFVRKHADIATR